MYIVDSMGNTYSAWSFIKVYTSPPLILSFHSAIIYICSPHYPLSLQSQYCLLKCHFLFRISTFRNVFLHYKKCETKCCTMPPYQCITLLLHPYTIHKIIFTAPEGGILTSEKICGMPL